MAAKAELKARLSLNTSDFSKGLARAKKESKSFAETAGYALGKAPRAAMMALTGATIGITAWLGKGALNAYKLGSAVNDMSDKTGIAAGQIRILQQAGKDNGIEDLVPHIQKMQANLVEVAKTGNGPAAEALNLLHLNAKALLKLKPADQLDAIAKGMQGIGNQNAKISAAKGIFGKGGGELMPLFADPQAIEKAKKTVGGLAKLYDENANKMDETDRKVESLDTKKEGFLAGLGVGIEPLADELLNKAGEKDWTEAGKKAGEFFSDAMQDAFGNGFGGYFKHFGHALGLDSASHVNLGNPLQAIPNPDITPTPRGARDPVTGKRMTITEGLARRKEAADQAEKLRETYRHHWDMKSQYKGGLGGGLMPGEAFGATLQSGEDFYHQLGRGGDIYSIHDDSQLDEGAVRNVSSLLSKKERDAIMNAKVAAGEARPNGGVKRGDNARRNAFLKDQEKKESAAEIANTYLRSIDQGINGE